MNSFVLKIIACITMFIDHVGYVIFNSFSWFNYIGRLSFPIFAFQISEGFVHTKNVKKYLLRLFIFAVLSQIPFICFLSTITNDFRLNVIFTLILGLLSIIVYNKNKLLGIFVTIILGIFANITNCDYSFYGVAITFLFYAFRDKKFLMAFSFILTTLIHYTIEILMYLENGVEILMQVLLFYLPLAISTSLSIIIILLYNKKNGPNTKYFLYIFYPLHLLILYGLSFIITI